MNTIPEKPMTFDAANRWLASRINLPTAKNSAQISTDFSARVKAQSFFSAKVTEASILENLREVSDSYSRGEINLATARRDLKLMLAKSSFGYVPSDVADPAAGPPEGVDEEDWKAAKSIENLASTRRLDLILRTNAAQAQAVGQEEISMDPDLMERFPYFRYIAHPDARPSHGQFNDLVLLKTDPFWATHTGPWDYGCRCGKEDCDQEEAAEYGGVNKSVDRGNGEFTVDINGRTINVGQNESGYVFDVREAFASVDLSRIKSPDIRKSVIESAEIEFGDQLKVKGAKASVKKLYPGWKEAGLESAKTWKGIRVPDELTPGNARKMLENEIKLTAKDGSKVTLGREVLRHWEKDKAASEREVNSRLVRLNTAIETVKNPKERWDQERQSRYLQVFQKKTGGFEGCLVAVTDDGQARTYFMRSVSGINNSRNGLKHMEFK